MDIYAYNKNQCENFMYAIRHGVMRWAILKTRGWRGKLSR